MAGELKSPSMPTTDPDERFVAEIRRLQGTGATVYKTWRILRTEGLSRSREAFRRWCHELIAAGTIPAWPPRDKRGRPKGKLKRSLDLFESGDAPTRPELLASLILLTPFYKEAPTILCTLVFGEDGLNIPRDSDGEPDFRAYARRLGWRRLQSLGDMDFYLLARWTKGLRERIARTRDEAAELNLAVLKRALEIRNQMIGAIKPRRRSRRKP